MNHFCTYFDRGFLIQGLALWRSLAAHDPMANLWVLALDDEAVDVLRELKERNLTIEEFPLKSAVLADLLKKVKAGDVDTTRGREVLVKMLESGKSADAVMAEVTALRRGVHLEMQSAPPSAGAQPIEAPSGGH